MQLDDGGKDSMAPAWGSKWLQDSANCGEFSRTAFLHMQWLVYEVVGPASLRHPRRSCGMPPFDATLRTF